MERREVLLEIAAYPKCRNSASRARTGTATTNAVMLTLAGLLFTVLTAYAQETGELKPTAATKPVPLTIKSVGQGTLAPATHTILTLKTMDGYIKHEVVPQDDGTTKVLVTPGKYLLSAIGAPGDLKIEVSAPETTVTIQVSDSGAPAFISQTMNVRLGGTRYFLNDQVKLSVNAITAAKTGPVLVSQIRAVLSPLTVASHVPSGLIATAFTGP